MNPAALSASWSFFSSCAFLFSLTRPAKSFCLAWTTKVSSSRIVDEHGGIKRPMNSRNGYFLIGLWCVVVEEMGGNGSGGEDAVEGGWETGGEEERGKCGVRVGILCW